MRRALAVALAECRAGRVAEHDKLYDPVLMATMDKAVEGRPIDPQLLREAMALLDLRILVLTVRTAWRDHNAY
jgi:hypothetical protein